MELTGYFDYEAYGRLNMKDSERLTDEGLVTRIKAPKPAVGKKQNPEVVQPGSAVFRVYLAFDKRYPEKICFYFPMTEKQLEDLGEKCRTYDVDEVADYLSNIWELDQFLPPRLTFRELNQIGMEIQNLADKTTVSKKNFWLPWRRRFPEMHMQCAGLFVIIGIMNSFRFRSYRRRAMRSIF